jgi:hypothetical protein
MRHSAISEDELNFQEHSVQHFFLYEGLNSYVLEAILEPMLGPYGICAAPLLPIPCMLVSARSKNIYIRKKTFFHLDNVNVKNQSFIIDLMT